MKLDGVQASADGIKETKAREWLIRFVFGGLVSLMAGIIGKKFGPAVGGLFLGFPSIMPATVTLVKKHHGREKAADDTRGSTLGSFGLIAFAIIVSFTAEKWGAALSLLAATAGWAVASIAAWLIAG